LAQPEFLSTTITPERTWRTRADPFRKVWKQIRRQIQKNPNLDVKTLFTALQRQYPGKFGDGQLRTLQRRVRGWRATEGPGKKVLVSGRLGQTSLENPHQRAFLAAFERSCCIKWAAQAAGITRQTHYHWLRHDSVYAAAFEESRVLAADYLENELVTRATKGWLEPVFFRGKQCGAVRRFDDGAAMFLLRGMMPEKYGNRLQIRPPAVAQPVQPRVEVAYTHAEDDAARKNSPARRQGSENSIPTAAAANLRPEAADAVCDDLPEGHPEGDQEIIALARRLLKASDATAPYLPNGRDRSRIVALPTERPYPKSAWT
jgi:hypothetical protein